MDDPDATLVELDRAIGSLGALGVQIFTNVNGHALDEPRFDVLFAKLSALDRPIWVHGARSFIYPEFVGDVESKNGLTADWPFGPPTEEASIGPTLRVLGELGLAQHDLALVLGDNARSLLGLAVTQ